MVNRPCTLLCADGLEVLQLPDDGIYTKFLNWLYSLISCHCTVMPSVSKMREKVHTFGSTPTVSLRRMNK